jgi:hypothetical protein
MEISDGQGLSIHYKNNKGTQYCITNFQKSAKIYVLLYMYTKVFQNSGSLFESEIHVHHLNKVFR